MKDKVNIIRSINKILVSYGNKPIEPCDFDILYDLEIDELQKTELDLLNELESYSQLNNN